MPRRLLVLAVIALGVGGSDLLARAEDAPPAPAPDAEREAALKRAEELQARVMALYRQGKYAEATPLARESLAIRETILGPDHPDLATSLNNLAVLLRAQGAHKEAKPLCERALAILEKALGPEHPDVSVGLNNLAGLLKALGAYAEARPLYERALAIDEKRQGPDHPDVARSLNNLASLLHAQGEYAQARPLFERVLAILEKALGRDHPSIATGLNNLAMVLKVQGAYAEARPLYERALAIREKALGPDHPHVAESLNNLAGLLHAQGDHGGARPLLERAVAVYERALGADHPSVADALNGLAGILRAQGAYAEARLRCERALTIREKALGTDHPDVATSLSTLADLLLAQGLHAEARPLLERALAIHERALGSDHPAVATSLNNLAELLHEQGCYAEARPLYERALEVNERALGKFHPAVANNLNNLAELLRAQGSYAEARSLLERALAINEKALGKDQPAVATNLNNLALLLQAQGGLAEARPLLQRALVMRERALGKDHPEVATSLNNLAALLDVQGAYAEARPLFERALEISQKALGAEHPAVATNLHGLAGVLQAQGASAAARSSYQRALEIYERTLGPDHPAVATSLINLAGLMKNQGSYVEARLLYDRALAIYETALDKHHPSIAKALNNLAVHFMAQGAYTEARPLFERALAINESNVRMQLSALAASQRLALARSARYGLDNWLDCAPHAGLSGHAEALRFRGIVARAEAAERSLARRVTDEQRTALASLQAATRLAARLANQLPAGRDPKARAAWQEQYARAAAERERLTRELASQVASARTALERLDLTGADVQKAIAVDTALVDLLRVRDRYVAWVLRAKGDAARVELGAAEAIDTACEAFVAAVAGDLGDEASRAAVAKAGADLRGLVWAPLEASLGEGVKRVVLCPDAALASVPFAALPGKSPGTYLGDELALSHVFHPFDLVPRPSEGRGVGALVLGGVDYERADMGTEEAPLPSRPPVLAALDRAPRGASFLPIPATRVEAEALRDRFGAEATTLLLGADATEARVREGVKARRFVHVATHGFARTDLLAGLYDRKIQEAFLTADAERQLSVGHDPMLLSGLALAGANPREGAGGDDGVLTALEASYLDLDGVDLVTLSACETAKGTAESGEGVLGLVSAFQMAGARGVLASLWKVDDEATQRLMEGVYERMLRKENPLAPADALREAARALRTFTDASGKARYAAPRYWAAFVAYGG